ncbi:hypothetical protein QD712_25650 [Streptomyces acidiscabies]|uniref:hypothetical protein n=1 Tax=Streptomyces acidiscabies TaxID=42234 RepID=UPI0030D07912
MTDPTTPPADRAALRERIRRAICEAEGFAWDSDMLEPDEYGEVADMVLAVLPDAARYRAAWSSARQRAQAYGEGILRVVEDREQWQKWCRQAEDAATRLTAERDSLGREADRLRKDWTEMRARAEQAEAEVARLTADRAAVLDEAADGLAALRPREVPGGGYARGMRDALIVGETHLRRMAAEAREADTQNGEALRCVCGDPVQLQDDADPTSWIHSPSSQTRCLDARPRCPHCRMPHDLTPSMTIVCASVRASTRDTHPASSDVVHACPPPGSGLTPCCGRTPFELPLQDRISSEAPVTCNGADR